MEIIDKLKNIPYLSKTALANFLNKKPNTLKNWISYWQKKGSLIRVKRGFYVFRSFLNKKDNSLYYSRFLATKMISPSYLSMEFMLQEYQMFADVIYGYSIVTTKKTNSITNEFGVFNYSSIKKDLFVGFSTEVYGDMNWFVASKAKALFDYIYFNQNKFIEISENEVAGLRLNLDMMNKTDWKEYKRYLNKAPKKMREIYDLMKQKSIC